MTVHEPAISFQDSADRLGREIEKALRPLFSAKSSLDLELTVRRGTIRIRFSPLYKGEGWQDRSGG
jgi:hypothetical protein